MNHLPAGVYRFRYGYSAYTGIVRYGYWTSKEALESKELPRSLVIIGGGVIGMEFAPSSIVWG